MATIQNPIIEGQLTFTFPEGAMSTKYDDWSFYRNQFNSAFGGTKAVDIIYLENDICWFIEIKDYRFSPRTKSMDLGEEVAIKVRDAIAGIYAAGCNANEQTEKLFACDTRRKNRIRVVLHLEQPLKHSKLFPKVINPVNVTMKLKQLLKGIDAHPVVVDRVTLRRDMNWRVNQTS